MHGNDNPTFQKGVYFPSVIFLWNISSHLKITTNMKIKLLKWKAKQLFLDS